MTPSQAKKIAAKALDNAGIPYKKLRAKTISFSGLGYSDAIFVKPIGARLPDPAISQAQEALRGTGVVLNLPDFIPADGMTIT